MMPAGPGIQGAGARLVAGIEGSWSNVVGLPVERLDDWLADLGLCLDRFRGTQDGSASSA